MGEQPFLGTAVVFVAVMTLALIRLGAGAGGRHWAAAWICLWAAGGVATLAAWFPAVFPGSTFLGTFVGVLFYTGTRRYLGSGVSRGFVVAAGTVAVARTATHPFLDIAIVQATGALLISAGALASSFELVRARSTHRTGLLALTFPLAAGAAVSYAWLVVSGGPPWLPVFIWLMAGILLSGAQVLSLVQRIADRAEGERAVLASLFEAVPVGLALFAPDGVLRTANHTFQKLAGVATLTNGRTRREAEIRGALAEQLEPADGDALSPPDGETSGVGRELRFRNGQRVVSALHAVTDTHGEAIGRLWLLRDVTDEQRLQEGLERARRLETLGEFAGGVAHDFNNQLTSVLGNAALLRDGLGADHRAREILDDLEASAEYCARLTRDVLDFARRGQGDPHEVELEIHLGALLTRRRTGARVRLAVEPGTPPVHIDPIQLERAIENLVDNACDAAGDRGSVEVRAFRSPKERGRVVIEVRDDGPGIEERMRARVFDPFYTTKPVGEGSGLGLAIVYGIVTAQGGEVRVGGRPGEGACFVTTWPAARSD